MLNIGCHLSSSKGYLAMGKEAVKIGASTFQFFTRNPRGGSAKPQDPEDVKAYLAFASEHGLTPGLAHAPYTLNPCSADPSIRQFARETMADDLVRLSALPGFQYNFHPGSHVKQGVEEGVRLIVEMLDAVLTPDIKTTVLLETMAGKGSEVGRCFEELRMIMDRAKLGDRRIHKLDIQFGVAHPNVHHDLLDLGELHHVPVPELLLQGGSDLRLVLLQHTRRHFRVLPIRPCR